MRESYIKGDIIRAVNCIVLPPVDISIVLCKDEENCLPPKIERIYLLIASEFIDICQRKGKDIFKWKSCSKKKRKKNRKKASLE